MTTIIGIGDREGNSTRFVGRAIGRASSNFVTTRVFTNALEGARGGEEVWFLYNWGGNLYPFGIISIRLACYVFANFDLLRRIFYECWRLWFLQVGFCPWLLCAGDLPGSESFDELYVFLLFVFIKGCFFKQDFRGFKIYGMFFGTFGNEHGMAT